MTWLADFLVCLWTLVCMIGETIRGESETKRALRDILDIMERAGWRR